MISISDSVADRLQKKLISPVNVGIEVEDNVAVSCDKDVQKLTATAVYSDGTTDIKKVRWDTTNVDFSTPGTYEIFGKVMQPHFDFPIAINRADPCITRINGKYYYIATNDADGNHTLYIRQADTMEALKDAEEVLLLDSKTYEGIGGLLWAPEFHEINGKLYIFHACTSGEFFWEESHVMELKAGGDPMTPSDWSRPKRVVRLGWANNHTFVDEGPFALIRGDKLYLTFSSAAVDVSYVVGLLQIDKGKDPMNPKNWKKTGYPILTARSVENEWGTGHNAYVTDEFGTIWNTYHARPGVDAPRSSGIRRVHFDIDGEPVLDLTEEKDLLPENKIVKTRVVVK